MAQSSYPPPSAYVPAVAGVVERSVEALRRLHVGTTADLLSADTGLACKGQYCDTSTKEAAP